MNWEAIFQSISDSVVITDEHGRCMWANSAALDLAGAGSFEDLQARGYSVCDRVLSSLPHQGAHNLPLRFTNLLGVEKEILVSFGPVNGVPKEPLRYFFIARDVSEMVRHNRMRQELMQVVSHELRNPLQVMKGVVQLSRIRIGLDMDKLKRYIDLLDSQINHVAALVEDILTAYRIGNGALALKLDAINLVDLITQARAPYAKSADRQVILVNSATSIPVKADPSRLLQVLSNLLSNAWKFTPPGKRVWVRTQVSKSNVVLRVEDEGEGIPADKLERIFEGFYRGENVATWKSGGIGVGLYVSRNIARRHGGDLWAETRTGGGTAMCLRLPLHGQLTLPSTAD